MLADALAQYLIWKKWPRWFLVSGPTREDKLFAEALKRSAKRFGGKIVEERTFQYEPGSRRYRRRLRADAAADPDLHAERARRTTSCSSPTRATCSATTFPIAPGTRARSPARSGLVPMSWHPAIELWGGTQFQNRFKRLADRTMRPEDYNAWMATRMIGEAASRTKSTKYEDLVGYMKSPKFEFAGFKGVGLSVARLERTAASADPGRNAQAARDRVAAAGLPAPIQRARYARHR